MAHFMKNPIFINAKIVNAAIHVLLPFSAVTVLLRVYVLWQ